MVNPKVGSLGRLDARCERERPYRSTNIVRWHQRRDVHAGSGAFGEAAREHRGPHGVVRASVGSGVMGWAAFLGNVTRPSLALDQRLAMVGVRA